MFRSSDECLDIRKWELFNKALGRMGICREGKLVENGVKCSEKVATSEGWEY